MPPPQLPKLPRVPSLLTSPLKATANWIHRMTSDADTTTNTRIPQGFDELVEGTARALYRRGEVFYNPAQVVNRDLSILVLRYFQRQRGQTASPIKILEALSATGLRSIRYFNEIPNIHKVIANDLDSTAVETIQRNVLHNQLNPTTQIIPNHANAITVMSLASDPEQQYHVIDLDPYGSAAPFLDAAVRAVCNGGILAVTCTDLAVLCGNSPEICYGRYAATPLKGPTAHEAAVRIVFASIQTAANRHGRAIEPIVCVKIDFYVRLFVRVLDSKSLAQRTPAAMSLVYQCNECGTQRFQKMGRIRENLNSNTSKKKRRRAENNVQPNGQEGKNSADQKPKPITYKFSPPIVADTISPKCSICDGMMLMGGPMWNGPLIADGVADSIIKEIDDNVGVLNARDRVAAILRVVDEEVKDVPLFMHLPSMCKLLRVSSPPAASIRSFLVEQGYKVSQSHTNPQAIKTNASPDLVWDVLRLWATKNNSPILKILEKKTEVNGETLENGVKDDDKEKRPSVGERILRKKPLLGLDDVDFTKKVDQYVRKGLAEKPAVRFPLNPEPYWGPKARAGKRKRSDKDSEAK